MRRTPLARKTKLKSTGKLKSRTRLKASRKPLRSKPTGQLALFLALYEIHKDDWVSQVSGLPLVHPVWEDGKLMNGRAFVSFFSHILRKSIYRKLRLRPDNLKFVTHEEHRLWEQERKSLVDKPEWRWVFKQEQKLKDEANGLNRLSQET